MIAGLPVNGTLVNASTVTILIAMRHQTYLGLQIFHGSRTPLKTDRPEDPAHHIETFQVVPIAARCGVRC